MISATRSYQVICLWMASLFLQGSVIAQNVAVFVTPTNFVGRAPNYARDGVNLWISEIVLSKERGLLSEDKSVAVYLVTKILGSNGKKTEESTVHQLFNARLDKYDEGTVSLPVHLNVLPMVPLTDERNWRMLKAEVSVYIIKGKTKTAFGGVVSELIDFTAHNPIPHPFSEEAKVVGDLFSRLLNDRYTNQNQIETKIPLAIPSFDFQDLSSQVTAVIFPKPRKADAPGFLDTATAEKFSFSYEKVPVNGLFFNKAGEEKRRLLNEHIVFVTQFFDLAPDKKTALSDFDDAKRTFQELGMERESTGLKAAYLAAIDNASERLNANGWDDLRTSTQALAAAVTPVTLKSAGSGCLPKLPTACFWAASLACALGIACAYLGVSGVLMPALCMTFGFAIVGFVALYDRNLSAHSWISWCIGASSAIGAATLGWLAYRATQFRKSTRLDSQISNSTIGALQEMRNEDARLGTSRFDVVRPYLEAWHTTPDGFPHAEVRREIARRLEMMNLRDSGKKITPLRHPRTEIESGTLTSRENIPEDESAAPKVSK